MKKNSLKTLVCVFLSACFIVGGESFSQDDKKNASTKKAREKNIIREKQYKGKQSKIDFDAIDILGEKKTPYGSALTQRESDKNVSLIKIRKHWHQEMVQSTSSLETGKK